MSDQAEGWIKAADKEYQVVENQMWEEINMSCPLGLMDQVYVLQACIIIRFCLYLTATESGGSRG